MRNLVMKSKRPSLLHKSLSNLNQYPNKNSAFKLDTACHEGLRFANIKLDRFSPGWRSQGQWAWCGRGIELSTLQVRKPAHSGWSITLWVYKVEREFWGVWASISGGHFAPSTLKCLPSTTVKSFSAPSIPPLEPTLHFIDWQRDAPPTVRRLSDL